MNAEKLIPQTINDEEVFFLQGGTAYLPTIYIKKNKHWGKWMVFEAKTHEVITNRTFTNKEACIDFVQTYDDHTVSTLDSLYNSISDPNLREFAKSINFADPEPIMSMTEGSSLEEAVKEQVKLIHEDLQSFDSAEHEIQLIAAFFDGYISLYVNNTDNPDERFFYLCIDDFVSNYKSWKTISVAKALFEKINSFQEQYHAPEPEPEFDASELAMERQDVEQFYANGPEDGEICELENGTKYLPSIYIQHNAYWNKWMIFDAKTHKLITNRTFASKQDCISFIDLYDDQSEETLNMLCNEIRDKDLRVLAKKIDFSNPQPIEELTPNNDEIKRIITAQKEAIATTYQIDEDDIEGICYFFDGIISLYTNKSECKNERMFYMFNNGVPSVYAPWKTVSLAISFFKKLVDYDKEQHQYHHLEYLVGKSLIDTKGNGFYFAEHLADTSFMNVQKIRVKTIDGVKTTIPELPLTPLFIAKVKIGKGLISLQVENHFLDITNDNEVYFFKVVSG